MRRLKSGIITAVAITLAGCAINPQPLTTEDFRAYSAERLAEVERGQIPVTHAIGLYDAMARALKYNLDYKVELADKTVRFAELDVASRESLPSLVAGSDYFARNNFSGGVSQSILSSNQLGPVSLVPSTSQERTFLTADLNLSWNILDFGLSRIRAKQSADQVLISEEAKRRVVNRVIEDVRTSYWRALSSQRLLGKLSRLEARVARALASSRQQSANKEVEPVTALTYERELVQIKREIQLLEGELKVAKTQLGALMNLKPGTKFTLKDPKRHVPHMSVPFTKLVKVALINRPELREVAYRERINDKELKAAMLDVLPGIQLFAGGNHDGNDFLFNSNFVSAGVNASWNLIKLFKLPKQKKLIGAQSKLLKRRAVALTLAIMTQVHVAQGRFVHSKKELATAREFLSVQRRLLSKLKAGVDTNRVSRQTLIREEMNTLVAQVRADIAYSNAQNAYANIFAAIGLDTFSSRDHAEQSLPDLTRKVRTIWQQRENGHHLDQIKEDVAIYNDGTLKKDVTFKCDDRPIGETFC